MSRDKETSELAQICCWTIEESNEVMAGVDKLAGLVGELRRVATDDAMTSRCVEEMSLALGKVDSLLKDLSSHLRQLQSRSAAGRQPSSPAGASRAKKKILVIDDERPVLNLVERVLRSQEYEVDTASGGLHGIGKVDAQFYDLVIIDLRMPEIAGIDVYRHIEARNPSQARHVVFFSGDVVSLETTEFLDHTGCPFLVKPFTVQELVGFVRQAFAFIERSSGPAAQ